MSGDADRAPQRSEFERVSAELERLRAKAQQQLGALSSEPGTDIIPSRSNDPVVVKQQAAAVRDEALKTQQLIRQKREELERIMRAEMARAQEMLGPLEAMVKQAQHVLTTVNLYLCSDEEIVLLRDGESAPAGQPIALRQMVLFMLRPGSHDWDRAQKQATDTERTFVVQASGRSDESDSLEDFAGRRDDNPDGASGLHEAVAPVLSGPALLSRPAGAAHGHASPASLAAFGTRPDVWLLSSQ